MSGKWPKIKAIGDRYETPNPSDDRPRRGHHRDHGHGGDRPFPSLPHGDVHVNVHVRVTGDVPPNAYSDGRVNHVNHGSGLQFQMCASKNVQVNYGQ